MPSERPPRATIIIPSYNHGAWVVAAVQSTLNQTVRDIEVLVIDDGSSDDSVALLRSIQDARLTLWTQANQGLSRTLNRGLEAARAPWIKFLPSDDLLEPSCIERQLDAARALSDCVAVFSLPLVVDGSGSPLADPAPQAWFDSKEKGRDQILAGLMERNFLCAPGALFARDRARAVGGFDASLEIAQDYDLWLKLLARGNGVLLSERLVRVRWHGANQSYRATPSSEGERATCLLRALSDLGLAGWVEVFRSSSNADEAHARRALAEALRRSGISEVARFISDLEGSLAKSDVSEPGARRSPSRGGPIRRRTAHAVIRRLHRWLSAPRSARTNRTEDHRRAGSTGAETAVEGGPRRIEWLVLAAFPIGDPRAHRSEHIALALARRGHRVVYSARFSDRVRASVDVRADAPIAVDWDLEALRERIRASHDRICILVTVPHAEAIALAREAGAHGARVLFDKGDPWDRRDGFDWYHPADEQALVEIADDLLAATRELARSLVSARRPVHYLPDAIDRSALDPNERPPSDAEVSPLDPSTEIAAGALRLLCIGPAAVDALDWDLIRAVAALRPSWKISIVAGDSSATSMPGNVRLLGSKTRAALRDDLRLADVCWLPLRRSPSAKAISPPGVLDALALHKPVIAPGLPELAGMPYTFRAADPETAIAAAEQAAATPPPEHELDALVACHDWDARALSLETIVARPTVEVIMVASGADQLALLDDSLEALLRFRHEGGYGVTVIEHGAAGEVLEKLGARDEAGEIHLLGSPLAGGATARNLALRATRGELVAFLDPAWVPRGAAWLAPATAALAQHREVGAVGVCAGWISEDGEVHVAHDPDLRGAGDGAPSRSGLLDLRAGAGGAEESPDPDIAFLVSTGLVVPRGLLLRAGSFDEHFADARLSDADLSFRLRDLGYRLVHCSGIDLERRGGPVKEEGDRAGRALLLSRWRHRRDYLRAAPVV